MKVNRIESAAHADVIIAGFELAAEVSSRNVDVLAVACVAEKV